MITVITRPRNGAALAMVERLALLVGGFWWAAIPQGATILATNVEEPGDTRMVKYNPDGTLAVDGESYRVRERDGDRYDVTRLSDGVRLGEFVWRDPVEVRADVAYRDIVRTIALAWSNPRAPIPLQ